MWQKTKGINQGSNPHTPHYIIHSNGNMTTTLLRPTCMGYLVVYISLKCTYDPKWKLFGCQMGGDLGHFPQCLIAIPVQSFTGASPEYGSFTLLWYICFYDTSCKLG